MAESVNRQFEKAMQEFAVMHIFYDGVWTWVYWMTKTGKTQRAQFLVDPDVLEKYNVPPFDVRVKGGQETRDILDERIENESSGPDN